MSGQGVECGECVRVQLEPTGGCGECVPVHFQQVMGLGFRVGASVYMCNMSQQEDAVSVYRCTMSKQSGPASHAQVRGGGHKQPQLPRRYTLLVHVPLRLRGLSESRSPRHRMSPVYLIIRFSRDSISVPSSI